MIRYRSPAHRVVRTALASTTAVLAVIALALPGTGAAEQAAGHDNTDPPDPGMVYDGLERDPSCAAGFRVIGTTLCTHGPDPAPPGVDIHTSATPVTSSTRLTTSECNGDGTSGLRTQVLYARSSDVVDRFAMFEPSFRAWADGADTIYDASAAETGGTRHIRFVHDANCKILVGTAVMSPTGDDNVSNTISELKALGFNKTNRKYMVFTDATVYCGIGTMALDDQPGPDNVTNGGPSYGRSDAGCWKSSVVAHEHMHNLGGVQYSAPHTSGGGHCVDEWDRMCYSDAPNFPPMQFLCGDNAHDNRFDCGHDDYYSTNPPVGSYLRTHWNAANSQYLMGGGNWGYVLADQPTKDSYAPIAPYQRNSSGATNTVTKANNNTGVYTVHFPNIGQTGGTVNVTAFGPDKHMCKVDSWSQSGGEELVHVRCFTNAGAPVDTAFTASFTGAVQNPGEMGYFWVDQPNASSTPSLIYQFNSTGAVNTVVRDGTGEYTATMPGLGTELTGHVKVTAQGNNSNYCKVAYWTADAVNIGSRTIKIRCFTAAGVPVDTRYTVTYVNGMGVLGVANAASAYVWASQPNTASYTPSLLYQFNSTGVNNTITRNGPGDYVLHIPGLAGNNGHVQVTAHASDSTRCKVTNFGASGLELQVKILCVDPAGTPMNATWTASYTR